MNLHYSGLRVLDYLSEKPNQTATTSQIAKLFQFEVSQPQQKALRVLNKLEDRGAVERIPAEGKHPHRWTKVVEDVEYRFPWEPSEYSGLESLVEMVKAEHELRP